MSEPPPPEGEIPRLDPELAVASAPRAARDRPDVIDTRRYRWMIGIFGFTLVLAFSIYMFSSRGVSGAPGVGAGHPLHRFVAPLAASSLNGVANLSPHCDPAHPNPQALNVCGRAPLVLDFFVLGSASCERSVDALAAVARRMAGTGISFGAVAIGGSHAGTAAAVRRHHWTVPVAYDADAAVGTLYGVQVCPIFELARKGGIVADRLIGDHFSAPGVLAARVRAALRRGS